MCVVKKGRHFANNATLIGADEADRSCRYGFRSFRILAHYEDGFPEAWSLFLDTARVRQDDGREREHPGEFAVRQGLRDGDVWETDEVGEDCFPYDGVPMRGENDLRLGEGDGDAG